MLTSTPMRNAYIIACVKCLRGMPTRRSPFWKCRRLLPAVPFGFSDVHVGSSCRKFRSEVLFIISFRKFASELPFGGAFRPMFISAVLLRRSFPMCIYGVPFRCAFPIFVAGVPFFPRPLPGVLFSFPGRPFPMFFGFPAVLFFRCSFPAFLSGVPFFPVALSGGHFRRSSSGGPFRQWCFRWYFRRSFPAIVCFPAFLFSPGGLCCVFVGGPCSRRPFVFRRPFCFRRSFVVRRSLFFSAVLFCPAVFVRRSLCVSRRSFSFVR